MEGSLDGITADEKDICCEYLWFGFLAGTYTDQFINRPLTKEYSLKATEMDKLILETEDLLEVLQYH